jgi:hypothetical protein
VQSATAATAQLQTVAADMPTVASVPSNTKLPKVKTPEKKDTLQVDDRLDLIHQKVTQKAVGSNKIGKAQALQVEGSKEVKYKFNDKIYNTIGELTKAMVSYQRELNKASVATMGFGQKFKFSSAGTAVTALSAVGSAMGFVRDKTVEVSEYIVSKLSVSFDRAARYMDLSRSTTASIESISRLEQTMTSLGMDSSLVGSTMVDLSKELANAGGLSAVSAAKFRSLGLDINAVAEMPTDKAFEAIAEKISGIPDPMRRAAMATQIFGDKARDLLPLINNMPKKAEIAAPAPPKMPSPKVDTKPVADSVATIKATVGKLATADFPPIAAPATDRLEAAVDKAAGSFKKLDTAMTDLDAAKINEAKVAVDVVRDSFSRLFDKVAVELAPLIVSLSDSFMNLASTGYRIGPIFLGAFKFVAYPIAAAVDAARFLAIGIAYATEKAMSFGQTALDVFARVVEAASTAWKALGGRGFDQAAKGMRAMSARLADIQKQAGQKVEDLLTVPSATLAIADVFKDVEGSAGSVAAKMNKAKMDAIAMQKATANAAFFKDMQSTLAGNQSPLTKAKEQLNKLKKMMSLDPTNSVAYSRAASKTLQDLASQYDMFSTKLAQPLKFGSVETEKTIIQSTQQDIAVSMKSDVRIATILDRSLTIETRVEEHLRRVAAVVEALPIGDF